MTALLEEEPCLSALQPLAYGYMRVACDAPDDKVRTLEQRVRDFATSRGLYFVTFFFEFSCGARAGFEELIRELQSADAHFVIVPSMRHFARSLLLQNIMIAQLEYTAGAEVLAMRSRTSEIMAMPIEGIDDGDTDQQASLGRYREPAEV